MRPLACGKLISPLDKYAEAVHKDYRASICIDGNTKVSHYRNRATATRELASSVGEHYGPADTRARELHKRGELDLKHLRADVGPESQATCSTDVRCARPVVPRTPAGVDVCGVVGTVCHHVVPVRGGFIDLYTYESFSYYLLILESVLPLLPHVGDVYVDFGCKLGPSWRVYIAGLAQPPGRLAGDPDLAKRLMEDVRLLVNWMHAEGHTLQCQLNHSGRHTEGAGRQNSEGAEQLWAMLKVHG
jgi:hypothetical protein